MLRQLEQKPYIKDLVKRLRRDKDMRSACGYDKAPTKAHISQLKKRLGVEGFQQIEKWLRHEALRLRKNQSLAADGLIRAACLDGTDFKAWEHQRSSQHTPRYGDSDARIGHGKKGFILSYQSLFLLDMESCPLGHGEAPVNVNEKIPVKPPLTKRSR
jgi:hypothetical protein